MSKLFGKRSRLRGERLEQCLQGGFEEVSRHLKELVRVMETLEGIHRDTPETPEMPPNPPVNPPGMVGPTETAAVPTAGLPGGTPPSMRMSAAPASGPPAAPASGHPLPAAPASGYPMPAGPVSGHPMPAGVGAGLPPPPTLPDSLFMAYCPERLGEQRPSALMGIFQLPVRELGYCSQSRGTQAVVFYERFHPLLIVATRFQPLRPCGPRMDSAC